MDDQSVAVFVFTANGIREIRGGGQIADLCIDIYRDIRPGEEFAGVGYEDLEDGKYTLDLTTGRLMRVAD